MSGNWWTWYLKDAESESRVKFLKLRRKISFFLKFGSKKSKLFPLCENWCTYYLKVFDCKSRLPFLKFGLQNWFLAEKIQTCPFYLNISTHTILRMMIPNRNLDFRNSNPKIPFWTTLGPMIQSCPFGLEIGAHSISTMLILNRDLDFWNFDSKINFWANLGAKIQSCLFCLEIGAKCLNDAESKSRLRFLEFRPRNIF